MPPSSSWPARIQGLVAARGGIANCHAALVEAQAVRPRPAHGLLRRCSTNARRPAASPTCASSPERRIDRTAARGPVASHMLHHSSSLPLLVAVCGYALWRGERDERIVAADLPRARRSRPARAFADRRIAMPTSRAACCSSISPSLPAFVAVALRSDRFWPLWVAGLQLTTALGALLQSDRSRLVPQAYAAARAILGLSDPAHPGGRHVARASPPDAEARKR